jgi:hypothetical protein
MIAAEMGLLRHRTATGITILAALVWTAVFPLALQPVNLHEYLVVAGIMLAVVSGGIVAFLFTSSLLRKAGVWSFGGYLDAADERVRRRRGRREN